MWPFDKKIRVHSARFIEDQVSAVFEDARELREVLEKCGFPSTINEVDFVAFQLWIIVVSTSLAKLPDDIQRAIWINVYDEVARVHGLKSRNQLEEIFVEYMRLFAIDMYRPGNVFFPKTFAFAMLRLVGSDDESVVLLRLALIRIAQIRIKGRTEFFRELRLL